MTETEIRDGYQHKLDELHGKVRGVNAKLVRWISTALDASRSRTSQEFEDRVVQERLEDALKLIEKGTSA